jgi:membrane-bound lytic murein transglycosylase MltF
MDPYPKPRHNPGAFPPKASIRSIAFLVFAWTLLLPSVSWCYERFNAVTTYDNYFLHYSEKFFGADFDWHYFKAQAIAESGLKPLAKSPCGAKGLMQLMPGTFRELAGKHEIIKGDLRDPESNVAAGIIYNFELWSKWEENRSFLDRLAFMFASFNAGAFNVYKAWKLAGERGKNPNCWRSVSGALPHVTGDKARETIRYVDRIFRVKAVLRK